MNEYSQLFQHCIRVLNEYDENISEETFLDEYFRINKVDVCRFDMLTFSFCISKVSNPGFVSTVLIDSIRYSAFINIVIDNFYKTFGMNVRRSEENVYKGCFVLLIEFECSN